MKIEIKEETKRPTQIIKLLDGEYECIEDILQLVHYENAIDVVSLYADPPQSLAMSLEQWEMLIKQIRKFYKSNSKE